MIRIGLIGAGKMGISHLAILGASEYADVVGVADNSSLVTSYLRKYTKFKCFDNYLKMLDSADPEAVVVAAPTRYHESIVEVLLNRGIHVFVEKPFCMDISIGSRLVGLAAKQNLINQVGYHNRFLATFQEAARLVKSNTIGRVLHFSGNMNGPVVTKTITSSWRMKPEEGGGCLMDYAAHLIDLIHFILGPVTRIHGAIQKEYYSKEVDDGVYAIMETEDKIHGVMNVNWSDDTYRKMSTEIALFGTEGKIIVDASEIKVFLKNEREIKNYSKGWNIKSLNQLCISPSYYLRGEEYTLQMETFIESVSTKLPSGINAFSEAIKTDQVIDMIKKHKTSDYGQNSIWG